jgi:hypothetical protein
VKRGTLVALLTGMTPHCNGLEHVEQPAVWQIFTLIWKKILNFASKFEWRIFLMAFKMPV